MTWSVRGIDDEVRETALAAARRSGKPVGEWLNSVIRETAVRPEAPPQDAQPDGDDPSAVEDLQRNLSDLAARLERLKTVQTGRTLPPPPKPHRAAPAPASTRNPGRIQDNLDEIAAELDRHLDRQNNRARPAPVRPIAEPAFVPEPATDPRLAAVLSALDTLDRRLQTIAVAPQPEPRRMPPPPQPITQTAPAPVPRPAPPVPVAARRPEPVRELPPEPRPATPFVPPVEDLDAAIAEIGRRQRVLAPEAPTGPIIRAASRPLIASDVDQHFRQLAERLDKIGGEPPAQPATTTAPIEAELRDLRALVEDGFDRRLAPLAETVAGLGASLRRVEERITSERPDQALRPILAEIAQLRADLTGLQPGEATLHSIELGYGDIRNRLDDLRQSTAEARFDPAIIDGVRAEIAEVRAALDQASVTTMTGLENRLVGLGRRIDQLVAGRGEAFAAVDSLRQALEAMPVPEPVDLTPIDERFDALDQRLAGIAAIEAQVGTLGRYLEAMAKAPSTRGDLAGRVVEDIAALSARIEALAGEPSPDDLEIRQGLAAIVQRLEDLGTRFDRFTPVVPVAAPADGGEVKRGLTDIVQRLEDIGGRIDLLERRTPALAQPLPAYDPEDLALKAAEAISARIDALADRIDGAPAMSVRAGDPDQTLIAAIDDRFARIVRQLDTAEDRFASLGAIEDTLNEIRTVLSSRTPTGDPTREAMREAVAEFVRLSQESGPAAAVASIATELGSLKTQTRDLEARTSDGLKAVQEALTSVASLLQTRAMAEPSRSSGRGSAQREDTRPIEPGSGKPPAVPEPLVAPRLSADRDGDEVADGQPLRRADFIAAARRAAQAAQTAKLAEAPALAEDEAAAEAGRQPGALARIGAALRGRTKPVAIIVGVLLLAGIATELSLNGADTIRRGLANAPSPMALLEKFRSPDPVRTGTIAPPRKEAAPQPIVAAPPALPNPAPEKAAEPIPLAPPAVAPGSFAKDQAPDASANRFVPAPKVEAARVDPGLARTLPDVKPVEIAKAPVALPPEVDPVATQGIDTRSNIKPVDAKPAQDIKPVASLTPVKVNWPMAEDKVGSLALRKAASGGDPRAAFEIGLRYAEGRGITQNGQLALEWYRRAAEGGFTPAQYRLASGLEKGLAGTRDLAEARRWYQTAAEKGNVRAMHNLGVLFANDRDMTTALAWFQKAAERGQKDSQFNLGIVNALGSGLKQDVATSYKWFALAAQQGDLEATKKRDDLIQYLDKTALASAKMAVETWKPQTIDKDINDETTTWTEASLGDQSLGSAGERIARAQTLLKTQGKFAGDVNGLLTDETKTAVKAFQRKAGLKPTGEVDDALIRALTPKAG